MDDLTKLDIAFTINKCIDGAISRTQKKQTHRPFHIALLTNELVRASAFERSFSTSFGQGPIEEISRIIISSFGNKVERQKETLANVYKGAIDEVERITSALRAGEMKPNWNKEVSKVTAHTKGNTEIRRIISDIWFERDGKEHFISIKTVKPNLDQTEIAKKDLLLLKAHNPKFQTYFGLFYNPGGEERKDYNWTMPSKIFNMLHDDCVLIGKDYWNFIGDENTYNELLDIFKEVGLSTRSRLNLNR